ncbi:fluoride efflux transporter CrcB [Tundrisphaera sp. TA3]|uniref:fluoride efflux transporter CrcB n=1 Tax=Tundrisphaera sp. TA3 TaxID=3435775 RepID=UPI003EBB881E
MELWLRILALSAGGALGVNARYWLTAAIERWAGARWPWATFLINVSGSFLIGVAATCLTRRDPHALSRLFLITGFLGGYTTFSTFALEIRTLGMRSQFADSLTYGVGSVLAGVLAVVLGVATAQALQTTAVEPPTAGAKVEGDRPLG